MDCLHINNEEQTLEATQVQGFLNIDLDGKPTMKLVFYKQLKIKFVFEDNISAAHNSLEEMSPENENISITHYKSFQGFHSNNSLLSYTEKLEREINMEFGDPQNSSLKAESVFYDGADDSHCQLNHSMPDEVNGIGKQKHSTNNSESLLENMNPNQRLDEHSLAVQSDPLAGLHCKLCNKWFSGIKEEREHQRNPECRIRCRQCGLVYPCRGDLFKHQYQRHDINLLQTQFQEYDLKKDAKWPWDKDKVICPICSKSIVFRYFTYHINTHFDEPSYKCCVCNITLNTGHSHYRHCKDHLLGASTNFTMKVSKIHKERVKVKKKYVRDKTLPVINKNDTSGKSDLERTDEISNINPQSVAIGTMNEEQHKGETKKQAYEEKTYRCKYCKKTFGSQEKLRLHKGPPSLDLSCKICDAVLPSQAWMIIHQFEVHSTALGVGQVDECVPTDPSGYWVNNTDKGRDNNHRNKCRQFVSCPVCSSTVTRYVLPEHIMRMHTQESPFRCCLCNFPCSNYNLYKRHCEEHMGKLKRGLLRCSSCPEVFQNRSELSQHVMVHKSICRFCNIDFKHSYLLQEHYNTGHNHQLLECSKCEKRLPSEHKLKEHEKHHRYQVRRPCPKCGVMVCRLSVHMHRSHPEPGAEFLCSMCPKKFKSQFVLKIHLRQHATSKSGETFKCPKCPKTFSCREYLTDHIKVHLERKLYVCHICGKKCTQKCNLRTHMRIHSDKKLFNCDVCGQGFNYKASLLSHQKSKHGSL